MKKIFSLLMVAAIVLTMSLTSFAADTVSGMKATITETDTDITVTITVGDVTNFSSMTSYIYSNAVEYVADSYTLGAKCEGWTVTPASGTGYIKFVVTTTDTSKYITEAGDFEVISYKVTKTTDEQLKSSDFTYETGNGFAVRSKQSKIACSSAGFYAAGNATSYTSSANFTAEYVDARTVTPPATEDKWETSAAPEGWTAPAALEGEVRRVAVFGKNATAKALGENEYGVTFGDNTYYGVATTDAVNAWAIVLVDTDGKLIKAGHEYTGTAFVGTTNWSVTVSAN